MDTQATITANDNTDDTNEATLVPTGLNEFALLRAHIARLEATVEHAQDKEGARRGEDAETRVTAPVTATAPPPRGRGRPRKEMAMQTLTTPAPNAGGNAPSFDSILAVATQLGTEAGLGRDVQIKFAMKVIEGAYLGALSLDPNKHGKDRRDGIVLAEAYVKAQKANTIFDAKADKSRKLISNLDKCIKLGSTPKWGLGQPLQTVNELVTYRQTMRKDPANAKKLDDAMNMVMRYATQQLKCADLIDGDELRAFAFKRDPDARTAEEILEGIRKTALKLAAGKINNCNELDDSSEVQKIVDLCTKRLKEIAKARGTTTP